MEALSAEVVVNDGNYEIFFSFNGVYTRVTRKTDIFSYEVNNFPVN
jgi:hypothetical protein